MLKLNETEVLKQTDYVSILTTLKNRVENITDIDEVTRVSKTNGHQHARTLFVHVQQIYDMRNILPSGTLKLLTRGFCVRHIHFHCYRF